MLDAYRMPDGFELEEGRDLPRALVVRGASDDTLHVLRGELFELLALPVRAREIERVDVHVPGEPRRELVALTREQVDDAPRNVRGREHLGQLDSGERIGPGGDDDGRVAADDRGRDPRDQACERRLVRGEDPDDTGRLGKREVEVRPRDRIRRTEHLRELVGPAGVPDKTVD